MADYNGSGDFRQQTAEEMEEVNEGLQVFSQVSTYRNQGFAGQWEEVAELVDPNSRGTFIYGNYNTPGIKKTQQQIDSTGMLALGRFTAICDSLLTPSNQIYQRFTAGGPDADYIAKDRETRLYFERLTKLLFYYRNMPEANFSGQNMMNYKSLGAYGNLTMFIDELDDRDVSGLRYKAIPPGECFFRENHQGRVDAVTRWFRLTARQAEQKWPGQLPPNLRSALEANSENLFNFIHCVEPRGEDYEADNIGPKGKRFKSYYISLEGRCLMFRKDKPMVGGFYSFPYAVSRFEQGPGEVYGRGPAMQVLPALKTLNAQKAVFLKQGHQAADPVLITGDDGIIGSRRPGAVNPGLVNSDGKPMVHMLPTGDIQISKEMMGEERSLINDAFYVTLFQILIKQPNMSATEVIERANEKGMLLAPTMGRQQSEYIGTMTPRELSCLAAQRLLPEMPPRLKEAGGHYHVVYDNPLSRLAKAQRSAGFLRTIEGVKEIVGVSGDLSLLDPFDFGTAIPAMAEDNAVPESWMSDPQAQKQKAQNRAKQAQVENQIKAAPAQAAMMKAQAVQAKAGMGQQGQPDQGQPPQGQPQGM